ncbi:MAG: histidine kinase [Microscillaceae bacterium]|jgi:ligand-binding sensor domain-containing protein|nr:histidine kinase [Microscillaceae bacterium]
MGYLFLHIYCKFGLLLIIWSILAQGGQAQTPKIEPEQKVVNPHPQPKRVHFDRLGLANQAMIGNHKAPILQDKYGYIWFSSGNEILRYDGYNLEKINPNANKPINQIEAIGEYLWVTSQGCLVAIHLQTLALQVYKHLISQECPAILGEKSPTELWVGINKSGIYRFDIPSGKFYKFPPAQSRNALTGKAELDPAQFLFLNVKPMPNYHQTWYLGASGVSINFESPVNTQYLFCFDTRRGEWTHYPPIIPNTNTYTDMYRDPDGEHLWLTAWNTGLHRLHIRSGKYVSYIHNNQLLSSIKNPYFGWVFLRILPWRKNELLLLGQTGIYILNYQTLQAYQLPHIADDPHSPEEGIYVYWSGLRDRNGIIWLGGTKSVLKIDPLHQQFPAQVLPDRHDINEISCGYHYDKPKQVIKLVVGVAGNNSLVRVFDLAQQAFVQEVPFSLPRNKPAAAFVAYTFATADNQYWLWDRYDGFFRWDWNTYEARPMKLKDEKQKPVEELFFKELREVVATEANGDFWLATNRGLGFYQAQTQTLKLYQVGSKQPNSLRSNGLESVFRDSRGYIWVIHSNPGDVGISRFHPPSQQWRHFGYEENNPHSLNTNGTFGINEDAQGRVWIATGSGLCYYHPQTDKIHRIPNFSSECRRPLIDSAGNVWLKVPGNHGIGRLDAKTQKLVFFGRENGFQYYYFGTQLFQLSANEFFFSNGIYFDARRIYLNPQAPAPRISSFKIFEKEAPWSKKINFMPEVRLNYDQNFLAIEFTAMVFTEPEKNEYAYRLIGYDRDWVYSGTRRTAYYTGLKGGEYVLEYKAANNHGFWGKVKKLKIVVIPPFWETYWFRGLLILIFLGLVYGVYRFRVGQIRREANFRRRLAETEMAALRAQMNPHFIFNCLSSIHHFTLINDGKSASKYLTKFARLIRLVLENSREPKLTLARELHTLQIYIEMELLRFSNRFEYQLQIAQNIEPETLYIPPLLLQPYVENAIWHGLMQKKKAGNLMIFVSLAHNNLLHIEIEDDGIGRAQAQALKSKSALQEKSFGMRITANRIEVINELFNLETKVSIIDLRDENGDPSGTKVVLEIPV